MTGISQPTFEDLELLAEVSQLLTLLDLDRVLERVIDLAARAVGARQPASLILYDDSDVDWGHIFVVREMSRSESLQVVRSVLDKGLAGWVFRNRKGTIIYDTDEDDRWVVFPDDSKIVGSVLCVPLMVNDQVLAVITLEHPEKFHFNEYHLRLITIVANQASVAIRNAQLFNRQQAQQRQIENVLQAIPDVLFVLNEDGYVLMVNDAALKFLGKSTPSQVVGRHLSNYLESSASLAMVLNAVKDLTMGQRQWSFEVRSERRGTDYQVEISAWRDEQQAGYIVAMHDVTTLRDLSRFKDEMLRIASHDLRSPLSLIVGYADMVAMDIPEESHIHEFVDAIRRSTQRMNALLDDLLRVEQVRRSPLELIRQTSLIDLARDAVESMRPLAERKLQRLELIVEVEDLPGVEVDPALLKRAMENLIGNAIKYTPEMGRIFVRVYRTDDQFTFEVQDTGIGIPEEHLPRLFESFYRVRDERAANVTGFGLGLNLVKTIIERHHGTVGVKSEIGVGSTFWFQIPLA
jgi:PAS domain S-box-containing protein